MKKAQDVGVKGMKRRLKLAEVRKNSENPCPFGLPIPFGCKYAGSHVERMAPIEVMGKEVSEDEAQMIGSANTKLLAWNLLRSTEKPSHCLYVGHLMEEHDTVECNFDDSAPGQGAAQALQAAPFYSKIFSGVLNGLYTYPMGFYSDYNVSRNLYFGTYSLQGSERRDLLRMAAQEIVDRQKTTNTSE
jgi:hypothetical protein